MRDAFDLLEKARYDFELFETTATSYSLFNLLYDLTHLHDWITKDEKFDLVKEKADELKEKDYEIKLVRQLCNRAKHFEKRHASPETMYQSGIAMLVVIGVPMQDLYFVVSSGKTSNLLPLCKSVLEKWEDLLKTYKQQGEND